MAVETRIECPVAWLGENDYVQIENEGGFEILSANRQGDLHVGTLDDYFTVNISDNDVSVL